LDCSRSGSSDAELAICCTAMVMLGRWSAWPMAMRGRPRLAAARPVVAIKRRRRRNMARTPSIEAGTLFQLNDRSVSVL